MSLAMIEDDDDPELPEDSPEYHRSFEVKLAEFVAYQKRVREECLCKKAIKARIKKGMKEKDMDTPWRAGCLLPGSFKHYEENEK